MLLSRRAPFSLPRFVSLPSPKYMSSGAASLNRLVITPNELGGLLAANKPVSVLDATWVMPNSPRRPKDEFFQRRIPGSRFLDLDEVASPNELGLKHMMPSEQTFAEACASLGIDSDTHVVLYDTHGVFSSPRALFMFRAFGHAKASILDGGLPRWSAEGFSTEANKPTIVSPTSYPTPTLDQGVLRDYKQMLSNTSLSLKGDEAAALVLDARPRGRFLGTDPEPRPGLSSGHMPNSISVPFNAFLDTKHAPDSTTYTVLKPIDGLRAALIDAVGTKPAQEILEGRRSVTTSCGSGMTAGVLWLGLKLIGVQNVSLYDESWTGYADPSRSSPIEKTI